MSVHSIAKANTSEKCYHCGEPAVQEIALGEHHFCCHGCKTVYQILNDHELDSFYELEKHPGVSMSSKGHLDLGFLEVEAYRDRIVQYEDEKTLRVQLKLPQVHCSSCVYLLENLSRIHEGVSNCTISFTEKRASISIDKQKISLEELIYLLEKIGYTPDFSVSNGETSKNRSGILLKIGVAGFCFGNVMLFTFPEYLGLEASFMQFRTFFAWLSLGLSLSVFYTGGGYLSRAWKGVVNKAITLDVPIALGMLVLFVTSVLDVMQGLGPGYLDSLCGLVFFLLLGRYAQEITWSSLSFDRDYKDYFPLVSRKMTKDGQHMVPIGEIVPGDELLIKYGEIIPVDGVLLSNEAQVDYAFVTGESTPERRSEMDHLHAGGRLASGSIKLLVEKAVDKAYLTQLWNDTAFAKTKEAGLGRINDWVSKYFTFGVLAIALITTVVWIFLDVSKVWLVLSSVLIVACPCALALSIPFTYGHLARLLGKEGLFLRNVEVIDKLSRVTDIVFDKTGTITSEVSDQVEDFTFGLNSEALSHVRSAASFSLHPLSKSIFQRLDGAIVEPKDYEETVGVGLRATFEDGIQVGLGSPDAIAKAQRTETNHAEVHVEYNGNYAGYFLIKQAWRRELEDVLSNLRRGQTLHLLTGDHNGEEKYIKEQLGIEFAHFRQSAQDKMSYVKSLQEHGKTVLMLGDGLNDSGALQQSDVGIAISPDSAYFTPASSAILDASSFGKLPAILGLARDSKKVIYLSFVLSILYNTAGLYFAVTAQLTPVVAAILMPLSSISVVGLVTLGAKWVYARQFKN